MWVKKGEFKCLVSFTCLRTSITNFWYLDSGCSRHMTGDKNILMDYKPLSEGLMSFGDGVNARVLGRGTLKGGGFPYLRICCMLMGLRLI